MKKPSPHAATARKARKVPLQEPPSPPLRSSGTIVFAGLCYLFTGFAFSYVDRGRMAFGVFCVLWLAWAVLGFGAGVLNRRGGEGAGRRLWRGMAWFGVLLALFPGFFLYPFARWICLVLMVVMGARAAQLRTRRDLYFTMTVVFTVCFLTTTHYAADWSLWFYLGPAWLFGALALAWLHAEGVDLSRWTQLSMTTGFVAVSCVIAACLFLFVPRPPVLGFGFLPGGDVPGLYEPPFGNQADGRGEQRAGGRAVAWATAVRATRVVVGAALRALASRGPGLARRLRRGTACSTACAMPAATRLRRSGSAAPSTARWTLPRRCATGSAAVGRLPRHPGALVARGSRVTRRPRRHRVVKPG